MINLSERLRAIAGLISNEEDIADIGTDHGYLPLYLLELNPDRKVIFTDINSGPLGKTKNIILREHPDAGPDKYDLRQGDGLAPVERAEVDDIVIAGMGGILISEILSSNMDKTRSFGKLILQPRTASDKLRKWLKSEELYIYKEILARENGRICEIIAVNPASKNKRNTQFEDELDFEFSPILIDQKTPIVKEWISNLLQKERKIEELILRKGSEASAKKLESVRKRIGKLENITDSF